MSLADIKEMNEYQRPYSISPYDPIIIEYLLCSGLFWFNKWMNRDERKTKVKLEIYDTSRTYKDAEAIKMRRYRARYRPERRGCRR